IPEQGSRGPGHGRLHRLHGGAEEGRSLGVEQPPATGGQRHHRPRRERQEPRAERPLCRNPRATGGLLPDRGSRSRRRALLGAALPGREPRDDRGASDVDGANGVTQREPHEQARAAAEAVARTSYGKLVAVLAARTRDVAGAEDALSEAFAAALSDWPLHG